jgi:hypothetical protein
MQVLGTEIQDKFPGVECFWGDSQVSTKPFESVKIMETPAPFKRSTSSGDINEVLLEEISLGYYDILLTT